MHDIIWVGKYASDNLFSEMVKKGYNDAAAHVSQKNIINALDNLGVKMDTLNAYNVPFGYSDFVVKKCVWSRTGLSEDVSVGYVNLGYFSHLLRAWALKKEAEKWTFSKKRHKVVVIVYGMQSSLLCAAMAIKKLVNNAHICLIVPDLPQYMDLGMSCLKKMLKSLDWFVIKKQLKKIDSFVLYTRSMAQILNIPDQKWLLMEGSIANSEILHNYSLDVRPKLQTYKASVMYSGKIDKKYGILEFLHAIELMRDENYEFWFTGKGNALDILIKASKNDLRIKYLGFITSREELLQKQRQSSMLINLRSPDEAASRYFFPSKLFEYMASGRPVLSSKLEGIPDEYYQYLIKINSITPNDIAVAIRNTAALSEDEQCRIGELTKKFILSNKTSIKQAERILNFLSSKFA